MKIIKPKKIAQSLLIVALLSTSFAKSNTTLKNGIWRATLKVKEKEAPFLFDVKNSPTDSSRVILVNGEERVVLSDIKYNADTLIIPIESYDAIIKATISNNELSGKFIKNYIPNDKGIVFNAKYNNSNRFEPVTNTSTISVDGKWDVVFTGKKDVAENNVGIFKTEKGIITGSILTNSGDMRYLEGSFTQNGFQLSAFSGLSPYLFEFTFKDKDHFEGTFFSAHGNTHLEGTRNDKASLSDPYSIAKLKTGFNSLGFSLVDIDGNKVSLKDEAYKNKVVVVSLLGSWCPNCLDETKFLAPWYKINKKRGVEIIGIAFERKDDFAYAKATLSRLKKKYGIEYKILFAGKADPKTIANVLPEIEGFGGYPTTFFIDKKGLVRKIHTGYNGPATGVFYEEFQNEFNSLIDKLCEER